MADQSSSITARLGAETLDAPPRSPHRSARLARPDDPDRLERVPEDAAREFALARERVVEDFLAELFDRLDDDRLADVVPPVDAPDVLVRPSCARRLFTVAAAICLARAGVRPRSASLSFTCSY